MIKEKEKGIAIGLVLATGAVTIYCGFIGWRAYLIPLQYIGFPLLAFGLAGLAGANIWVGPFAIEPENNQENEPGSIS